MTGSGVLSSIAMCSFAASRSLALVPTANAAVKVLEALGIVTELTGQKKNRTYSYQACISVLSGSEPAPVSPRA